MNQIRSGQASNSITEGCLVLEGGAFRGLYSQGVLDALMENDINFRCVIGVSAGALSGLNYCSGQIGRSARINLSYRHDGRYVGIRALRKAHSLVNLDFLLRDVGAIEPFNWKYFSNPERRFVAVCANVNTGKAEYLEKGSCDILSAVKASASMPYVSPEVIVDGQPYLDGGTCCKIPYQWAIDQGYAKIVVVRTRDRSFRKKDRTSENELADIAYRHNHEFAKALADSNINYNRQCDELIQLEKQGRIFVIAPQQEVMVSRVEADLEKLGDLYLEGYREMNEQIGALKEYLNK
ncbi:MAG: patatin family protein [Erysipelotrichaceae bacterium]|nr:patatin family protein [Erysipelotrichaceae bacterium]